MSENLLQIANRYSVTPEYGQHLRDLCRIARDYSRLRMTGFSEDPSFDFDYMIKVREKALKMLES